MSMALHFDLRLTPQHTLHAVMGLRVLAILAQVTVLLVVSQGLGLAVPLASLLWGVAFLTVAAVLLGWRLKRPRSEEHTSELQSRGHLVCRLLLEKKKNRQAHACAEIHMSKRGMARRCVGEQ